MKNKFPFLNLIILFSAATLFFISPLSVDAAIADKEERSVYLIKEFEMTTAKLAAFINKYDRMARSGKAFTTKYNYGVKDKRFTLRFRKDIKNRLWFSRKTGNREVINLSLIKKTNGVTVVFKNIPRGDSFVLSLQGRKIFYLRFEYNDKSQILFYHENNIKRNDTNRYYVQHLYPDRAWYRIYYFKGHEKIDMSQSMADKLFGTGQTLKKRKQYIYDLHKDAGSFKYIEILKTSLNKNIHPGEEKKIFLFYLNYIRKQMRLPQVSYSRLLEKAGNNHLKYVRANWRHYSFNRNNNPKPGDYLEIHREKPGKAFYTGAAHTDRAKHVGYLKSSSEAGGGLGHNNIMLNIFKYIDTVYHRRIFLLPETIEAGYSYLKSRDKPQHLSVIMFGMDKNKTHEAIYTYPPNSDTNVPVSWSGIEAPSPLYGKKPPFGYPITVMHNNPLYRYASVTLIDNKGRRVPIYTKLDRRLQKRNICHEIIPQKPLKHNTRYTIVFQGKNIRKIFTFKTRSKIRSFMLLESFRRTVQSGVKKIPVRGAFCNNSRDKY